MTNAPWSYSWRYGRSPRSAPGSEPVPRWYRYTCSRCAWRSVEVDKYRGPAARAKVVHAALEHHLKIAHG